MSRSVLWIGLAVVLGACVAEEWEAPGDDAVGQEGKADGPADGWTSVGYGVAYQRVNTGNAVLIVYGGYTARLAWVEAWASELVDAELGAAGVGRIYAVQGPRDAGYNAREIGNSKLRAHLAAVDEGDGAIYVVAHSSGAFVAHELLRQLDGAGADDVLARIAYANLDGGGSGLSASLVAQLRAVSFVYARDPTLSSGYSQNNAAARSLGATYAPKATTFEVVVPSTGCANGAGWCLHDVVVTHRPHNPWSYDLARDYTDFVDRPVTTEYLAPLIVDAPSDPPPDPPATDDWLTVDDDNALNDAAVARCELSSAWTSASATPGYYGAGYAFATVQAVSDPAVFWFYIDADGEREIEARWTAGTNRTDAAPFRIEDGDGSHVATVTVDQQRDGGQWNRLGRFALTAGWNRVELSRWASGGAVVVADAIRVR